MRYGSVKHIALYYKAIPGMLRLLRQERAELEGNYYGLRGLACDGMPRGSSPGKPTEESGLRALENGVSERLAEIEETERVLSGDEACIRACLDALNGKYKEVIVMRYVRGYSWAKISARLGTADSTARDWHTRAMERLGEVLEVKAPVQAETPAAPAEAPRPGKEEQIVYIKLSELHAFKNHPFQVRNDEEMKAMVSSVRDKGVTQPAIVRPREDGGYEIVSGHRRQKASELAGFVDMPCIVRDLTDEQAITQMVEDNTNQRENILPSERAKALKMQLEAIKHQGAKEATSGQLDPKDAGRRSNEIVAERNKMTVKQVQRYIKLNDLVPDLQKMMDAGQIKFTPAVELAYIKPKNQRYIAVAIEGQQSAPSLSQAQRMRELDQKGVLNGDVIDGIMMEDKKEVDKVILTGAELGKYFGKETTPREMKDQIIKLLDDWKGQQKEVAKPEKKAAQQEK